MVFGLSSPNRFGAIICHRSQFITRSTNPEAARLGFSSQVLVVSMQNPCVSTMHEFTTKYFVFIGLAIVLLVEIVLLGVSSWGILDFKHDINIQTFTVLPLFILAILQLGYNGRLQRTDFLRNYSEGFFT